MGDFEELIWKDLLKTWFAITNNYIIIRLSYLDMGKIGTIMDSILENISQPDLYMRIANNKPLQVYSIHKKITCNTTIEELETFKKDILMLLTES